MDIMDSRVCDLHTHTLFSDGTLSPSQLIDLAWDTGLSAIALTDHNTVDGLYDANPTEVEDAKLIPLVTAIDFANSSTKALIVSHCIADFFIFLWVLLYPIAAI